MAFKFFNIGKANEEIDKLESSVAQLTEERDAIKANSGEIEAAAETFKGELTAARQKAVQLESDLATARQSIATLTTERDTASAAQNTAEAKLANPSEQVKALASAQALEITAKLGQPPVTAAPPAPANPAAGLTGLDRAIAAHKSTQPTK